MNRVQQESGHWIAKTFPGETLEEKLKHLQEEIDELKKCPSDPMEMADCALLLFDIATYHGVDLLDAARAKLEINRTRKWEKTDDGYRHK